MERSFQLETIFSKIAQTVRTHDWTGQSLTVCARCLEWRFNYSGRGVECPMDTSTR
ncbi:hypothetical protein BCAR13_100097 [Paraburkholderia caribensis]|nr:hypothetical protein BCAR13_100097 [Paraburkholderia caribensis]